MPKVFVAGRFFCDTVPLDRFRNATRRRRRGSALRSRWRDQAASIRSRSSPRDHYARTRGALPPDTAFRQLLDAGDNDDSNDNDNDDGNNANEE
ncbi:MAG: hypothetical protein IPM35_28020 [Myxococcales bacterium]|nr:hypothetical protein [Myxococcales bacterium]